MNTMKRAKKTLIYPMYLGAALIMTSGLFEWYTYPQGMQGIGRIPPHNTISILGFSALVTTFFITQKARKKRAALALVLGVSTLIIFGQNHVGQAELLREAGIGMSTPFTLGLLGAITYIVASGVCLARFKK